MTSTIAQPVPTVALSLAELVYLLHLAPADGQALTRERLQLVAEPDQDVLRSGLSALAARAGVGITRGSIRPTPENAVVAAVLATAQRWVEIGVAGGGRSEVVHVVEGSGAVLIVNRRPLGVLEFAGLRPGVAIAAAVLQILTPLSAVDATGRVVVNAVGFGGPTAAIHGVRRGAGWTLARWSGAEPLVPDDVRRAADGANPTTGWANLGHGSAADLLSWAAITVGGGAPAGGPSA